MALESGTYISDLVSTNPASTDGLTQADDHLRLIKSTVKATFPNISGAVTPTHTELNYVDGVTSAIQTQLDNKQPLDAGLTAYAALVTAADKGIYYTASDTPATYDLTAFARTLLDDADAAAVRTTLGLGTMATQTAASYALLASPAFTGSPTLATPAKDTNSTVLATTAYADRAARNLTVNAQTGTAYTGLATDAGKVVTLSNAAAVTVTINNSVHTASDRIDFIQLGAGQVSFAAGAGFTLRSSGSKLKLTGQYSGATIYFISASEGVLIGDLTA